MVFGMGSLESSTELPQSCIRLPLSIAALRLDPRRQAAELVHVGWGYLVPNLDFSLLLNLLECFMDYYIYQTSVSST